MTLSVVQAKAFGNASSGSLATPATAGNTVVVVVTTEAVTNSAIAVTGVTLGGSADHFAQAVTKQSGWSATYGANNIVAIWVDPDCAGGQTAIVVSGTNLNMGAGSDNGFFALEVEGLAPGATLADVVDVVMSSSATTGTAITTGTSAATAQADEIVIAGLSGDEAISGLTSGYTTLAVDSGNYNYLGYKIVTATGTQVFAGTQASSGASAGALVTLKAATGTAHDATAALGVAPSGAASGSRTAASRTATAELGVVASPDGTAVTAGPGASLPVTVQGVATAARGHEAAASLGVEAGGAAGREHAATQGASLAVAPSGAALGGIPRTATASLGVTPSPSAAGFAGGAPHSTTASLSVTAATAATAPPPFPASPLDLRGELLLGGTWTDVSGYAYQRAGTSAPVKVTRGEPDESSQVNPAKCSWQLNNRDGRFSPRNPLSPYYGLLGRNTPVRWSVPAVTPYLRLEASGSANCADSAALAISGSIEMRIGLRLSDWQGCVLACKWDGGGCWAWGIDPQGQLFLAWYDSGGTYRVVWSSQPVPFSSGDFALAVTMDATTGTVTFYSGDSVDGTFTQVGNAASGTGGAASSVAVNHGSQLQVGWSYDFAPPQLYGRVYEFRLYDGLSSAGAAVAADAVFTSLAAGTAAWADGQGNSWSLGGGAEVSGRDYRFHGELSSQPPKWDVTGRDQWVAAQAAGPLRRLRQASNNAMSAMKRAILSQSGALAPVAYWPMEDATEATRLGAALGSYPMTFTQNPAPSLSSDSTFTASASLPSLNGARMQGQVAPYTATGTWTVRFLLKVATSGDAGTLLRVVTAGGAIVYVGMEAGGYLRLIVYAPDGTEYETAFGAFPGASTGVWCSVEAQPASGGGVQYSLVTLMPGAATGNVLNLTVADETAGAGVVRLVQFAPQAGFSSTVVGHCTVQSAWSSLFTLGQPLNAWTGELAAARYARLAAENGYACRVIGLPAYSAVMGPQGQATLTALLQECEAADLGMEFEPRQVLALGYRTLASMLNQPSALFLDYAQSQPGGASGNGSDSGLDPTYDDRLSKNDWTLTRGAASGSQGGTWQAQLDDGSPMSIGEPPDGIGDYASTQTVNVETDAQLPDVAGWMVHEGTVDEARWPAIPVNLARPEMAALRAAALALDCGDHLTLLNVPGQVLYDPVEQLAYGFTEQLGGFRWTVAYNCVPEDALETGVFDDPVRGRCDTDGSALVAAVTATATTLSVATTGPSAIPWTTDAADCPFDVAIAGERVTVTAVAAPAANLGTADGTFESGVGDWAVAGGTIVQTNYQPYSGTYCAQVTASGTAEVTLEPAAAHRVPVVPGAAYTASMQARATTAVQLAATIWWFDASGAYLTASGGPLTAVTAWTPLSVTAVAPAGAAYALYGPAWPSPTAGGYFYADVVTLGGAVQALTVARAVNGVAKPQAAGADVRLWSTPVYSLA